MGVYEGMKTLILLVVLGCGMGICRAGDNSEAAAVKPAAAPVVAPVVPAPKVEAVKVDDGMADLRWALSLNGRARTPEENDRYIAILRAHGGWSPENLARLTAIVSGASVAEVEAITQTAELKRQTAELREQNDRLFDIQRNQTLPPKQRVAP